MRIDELLQNINSVCITGHISPDGDCAGSTLALYSYISKNYPAIETAIYLDPITDKLTFLANAEKIDSAYACEKEYDLMFCIDAASKDRIGKSVKYFDTAKKTVNIDHHISNTEFAKMNYVEPHASSACEVLYGLLDPKKLDRDIAICLYTGILYDTGVFKYPSTSAKTMQIVAKLMEFDIPTRFIIDESFYLKSFNENRIYGYAIYTSQLAFDGKVIYSHISKDTMNAFHVTKSELEGIVAQMLLTKGVECSVFVYDIDENSSKVSLRSVNYVDVNQIAQAFGGGGHVRAAGCTVKACAEEAVKLVLEETGKYI